MFISFIKYIFALFDGRKWIYITDETRQSDWSVRIRRWGLVYRLGRTKKYWRWLDMAISV